MINKLNYLKLNNNSMENKLEDINKIFANRVSPYQYYINSSNKNQVIERFKYQLWQIWSLPMLLTYGELICLKHQRISSANTCAFFKFTSISVAILLSFHFYSILQHKLNYFDALYPHASKAQRELTKDMIMYRQKHK